jgi:long-chain fatty acid transport protein
MKKIVLLSMTVSSLLLATNGDNLISLGAESRSMGGTGVAMGMGTDSVFKNPSWLTEVKGTKAMFGATLFMPDVKAKNNNANGEWASSKADMSLIPSVSHASRISKEWAYGIGMFGVSGMGADYRGEDPMKGLASMRSTFQYLRMVPSLAYKKGNLRLGGGLTFAYGALDISSVLPTNPQDMSTYQQRGGGMSDDFGFGFQLGTSYIVTPEINIGAYYQSQVDTEYENSFDFNMDGRYDNLKLSQPAEYGIGVGYKKYPYRGSVEIRKIDWSKADGYDTFGWDDQTVLAIGGGYFVKPKLELRAGYSHANSPLDKSFDAATIGGTPMPDSSVAFFNITGFPAITEDHFTLGFGYTLNKEIDLDLAYVYAPKESLDSMNMKVENSQSSLTATLKYNFNSRMNYYK